jgi:hypothetical protein
MFMEGRSGLQLPPQLRSEENLIHTVKRTLIPDHMAPASMTCAASLKPQKRCPGDDCVMPRFLDMTDFAAAVHGLLPCARILDRWARHVAIGAEHAAFSFLRLEPRSASLLAAVLVVTAIGWNYLEPSLIKLVRPT